jgi:hypothetical protein
MSAYREALWYTPTPCSVNSVQDAFIQNCSLMKYLIEGKYLSINIGAITGAGKPKLLSRYIDWNTVA